jgi:hypothetical protein
MPEERSIDPDGEGRLEPDRQGDAAGYWDGE